MTAVSNFFCFPVCKTCTDGGLCPKTMPKMESVPPDEYVRSRAVRNFNIASAYLPCGCFGLPWPIVAVLGENIEEVLCENCGWVKVKKGYKFSTTLPKPRKRKGKGPDDGSEIPF